MFAAPKPRNPSLALTLLHFSCQETPKPRTWVCLALAIRGHWRLLRLAGAQRASGLGAGLRWRTKTWTWVTHSRPRFSGKPSSLVPTWRCYPAEGSMEVRSRTRGTTSIGWPIFPESLLPFWNSLLQPSMPGPFLHFPFLLSWPEVSACLGASLLLTATPPFLT